MRSSVADNCLCTLILSLPHRATRYSKFINPFVTLVLLVNELWTKYYFNNKVNYM